MKQLRFINTVWLLLALTLMLKAQQPRPADASTAVTIRALERQWVDAQSRHDNRSLNLIFDNGMVYVENGKLIAKGDYLARVKNEPPTSVTMEDLTIRVFGFMAIASGTYIEKAAGTVQPVRRWRFVDTWVFEREGWVLVAAAASPVSK